MTFILQRTVSFASCHNSFTDNTIISLFVCSIIKQFDQIACEPFHICIKISDKVYIKNQVDNILQQSVYRKDRCKFIYLFHSTIKTSVYGVICFIISGILCIQEVQTEEIEGNLLKDKIFKLLEKIPQSADNLYIGPLRIHPSIEISETYDDNVLNAPSVPVHDFYNTYNPRIALALPIRDHSIEFDYGYTIFEYEGFSSRVPEQDRVNRNFGGSVNLNFLNGFSLNLSNRVSIIRTPAGGFTRRNNQRVQFPGDDPIDEPQDSNEVEERFGINTVTTGREATNNNASINIDLPDFFSKLDFRIEYRNTDVSFKGREQNGNERNDDTFKGRVIIKPLPRINIETGFDYTVTKYDSALGSDSIYRSIPFDISWQPTLKSTFFLSTRFNDRDYSRRSPFENFSGYNATLGYRFNVTQRNNLTIKLERSLIEQQFQTRVISSTETVPDTNPYYFTQIDIDWIHRFPKRFSIIFSPTFQHLRFREKNFFTSKSGTAIFKHEKVDTVRFEIKGRYDAPRGWLFSEISYGYQDRNSNLAGGDMIKNTAQISVGINF